MNKEKARSSLTGLFDTCLHTGRNRYMLRVCQIHVIRIADQLLYFNSQRLCCSIPCVLHLYHNKRGEVIKPTPATMKCLRERLSAVFWLKYVCVIKMGTVPRGTIVQSKQEKIRVQPSISDGGKGADLKSRDNYVSKSSRKRFRIKRIAAKR